MSGGLVCVCVCVVSRMHDNVQTLWRQGALAVVFDQLEDDWLSMPMVLQECGSALPPCCCCGVQRWGRAQMCANSRTCDILINGSIYESMRNEMLQEAIDQAIVVGPAALKP